MKRWNVVLFTAAAIAAVGVSPPAAAQSCDPRSATGHIEFVGSAAANNGRHIQYSFSAILAADPDQDGECKVHGEVEERLYSGEVDVPAGIPLGTLLRHSHGDVVCVSFSDVPGLFGGNTAWIAYRGDRSDPPVQQPADCDPVSNPGPCITHGAIVVEDNGEGAHDPPDRASAVLGRTEQGARDFCRDRPLRPLGIVIRGNVQVRR
jgi:hypothetical protein